MQSVQRKMQRFNASDFGAETEQPIELERFLPYIVHRLGVWTSSARSLVLRDGRELRIREWRVMLIVGRYGRLTGAEIAQHAAMDTGSTTRAVRSLIDQGLLIARTPRADRRKQILALTAAGVKVHDEIAAARVEFSRNVLSCLSEEERETLFSLLHRVQASVEEFAVAGESIWLDDE